MHEDEKEDDFQYDLTENELVAIIFNSEITNGEVLKSIQALKCGKSAGTDEIIPEFCINSVDNILPLLNRFLRECLTKQSFQLHGVTQLSRPYIKRRYKLPG